MTDSSAASRAAQLFRRQFGGDPAMVASAPGRVNLIGEHLDYNGGPVLPFALERRTAVAVAPHAAWELVSDEDSELRRIDPDARLDGKWTDYIAGVVQELRAHDAAPRGARVAVGSTLPIGAGLSSSAALTVSAAAALARLARGELAPETLADVAYRAEHDRVGVLCGRMDQTIAAHARPEFAMLFDTRSGAIRHVPLPGDVWVVETGISHRLTGGELNQRRAECERALAQCRELRPALRDLASVPEAALPELERVLTPELFRRVRHVATEVARTLAAAEALAAGDRARVGALLVEGHRSLQHDYESTVEEADAIVDSAVHHGALGARLTGAGWGGAVVVLTEPGRAESTIAAIVDDFSARYARKSAAWRSRAAGGVRSEETTR